jgi:hypothetical protein
MSKTKGEVITFKADAELFQALQTIPNRSEFIRAAILAAMENVCPVCQGAGLLTLEQRRHWEIFARDHRLKQCGDCDAHYIVCECNGSHNESLTDSHKK